MTFVLQDDRRRAEAVCGRGDRSGQQLHEGGGVLVSNEEKEQFDPFLDVTLACLLNFVCAPGSAWLWTRWTFGHPKERPRR